MLQRSMDGASGDNDSYEARGGMMPGQSDWDPGHRGQHQGYMELATGTDQRLSDMMPDIAMAGATSSMFGLSLSRSVPASPPPGPGLGHHSLSPDLVEISEPNHTLNQNSRWSPRT